MKRHLMIRSITLLAMVLACAGCKQDPSRATLHLTLQQEGTETERSLVPEGTPLEVSHYIVKGNGPSDSTFSIESDKPNIEIEGLEVGTWNLHAIGQNSCGTDLVEGSTTCKLDEKQNSTVIELDSLKGTGTMDITFEWDPTKITNASIVLSVTGPDGVKETVRPTTDNIANGSVSYSHYYPAGSYTVQAQLYSGTILMAGTAQVVRVVGSKTTIGSITLDLEDVQELPSSLTLVNKAGTPIECSITGISTTMEANRQATATISTEELGEDGLEVTWFLDGKEIGTGIDCTFVPESGMHRLDVIAKGVLLASDGSASFPFTAEVTGTSSIPIVISEINDGSGGICCSGDTQIAFLPDGNLLMASATHETLQVCRIVRDSVEVLHTYDASDSFNTEKIADILVDRNTGRVAVADNENPGIGVYQYDPNDATLTKLFYRDNTKYVNSSGEKTYFDALDQLAFDGSRGELYSTIPDSSDIPITNLYATTAEEAFTNDYVRFFPNPYKEITGIAISGGNDKAALISAPDEELKLCTKNNMDNLIANDQNFGTDSANPAPYLDNLSAVAFIDESNVVCGTDRALSRFTNVSSLNWEQADIWIDGQNGIDKMQGIVDFMVSSDTTMLYALCRDSRNIDCFSVDPGSSALTYRGATPLGSFIPAEGEISPDNQHMVIVSGISNKLLLCRIPR